MKFEVEYLDDSAIEKIDNKNNSFKHLGDIELNYNYIGEPNNGRVQLEVELMINKVNAIPEIGIPKTVFLPNQYPSSFDLLNYEKKIISIPHSYGVYLVDLDTFKFEIIKYLRSESNGVDFACYKECFFHFSYFILVGRDSVLIYNTKTKESKIIELQLETQEEIQSMKIVNSEIIILVANFSGRFKYFLISKFDNACKNSLQKYLLNDCIDGEIFACDFKYFHVKTFDRVNNYKDKSIIDSWTPLFIPHDKLIGSVYKYDDCKIDENGKITRRDSSAYIEIKIKNEC